LLDASSCLQNNEGLSVNYDDPKHLMMKVKRMIEMIL
jgi:hypothetical protein